MLNRLCQADFGERPADERAKAGEAALQHRARAPCDSDVPGLEHLERHDRRVDQVPEFMREVPEPLAGAARLTVECGLVAFAPILGHGTRNRVVQAAVQHAEVVGADRRVGLHREFGNGLTHVAVRVDDL